MTDSIKRPNQNFHNSFTDSPEFSESDLLKKKPLNHSHKNLLQKIMIENKNKSEFQSPQKPFLSEFSTELTPSEKIKSSENNTPTPIGIKKNSNKIRNSKFKSWKGNDFEKDSNIRRVIFRRDPEEIYKKKRDRNKKKKNKEGISNIKNKENFFLAISTWKTIKKSKELKFLAGFFNLMIVVAKEILKKNVFSKSNLNISIS